MHTQTELNADDEMKADPSQRVARRTRATPRFAIEVRTLAAAAVAACGLVASQPAIAGDLTVGSATGVGPSTHVYDLTTLDSSGTEQASSQSNLNGLPRLYTGQPFGVAYDPAGDLTVASAQGVGPHTKVYNFTTLAPSGLELSSTQSNLNNLPRLYTGNAFGIAYNPAGQLTVASAEGVGTDTVAYDFTTFDANGTELSSVQSNLAGLPRLYTGDAFGFTYDAAGDLVVGYATSVNTGIDVYNFATLDASGTEISIAHSNLDGLPRYYSGDAFGLTSDAAGDLVVGYTTPFDTDFDVYNFATLDSQGTELSIVHSNLDGLPRLYSGQPFGLASVPTPAVAGVPEPASWSLAILGFFGVAMTLRRARETSGPKLVGPVQGR